MAKIDIISGFLGAGKTTLIKKLIQDVFAGQKVVLIENEFGEIGIDGGFLKEAGINITEMNSGCICCSLVGDFSEALKKVVEEFHPDHIIIEPSGVGKLSDIRSAIENTSKECDLEIGSLVTVADVKKAKMYMKNFGEFYNNQIESAGSIILSRTQDASKEKIDEAIRLIREKNPDATIITTPWDELNGKTIHDAMMRSMSIITIMRSMSTIMTMRSMSTIMIMRSMSIITTMRSMSTIMIMRSMSIIMTMRSMSTITIMKSIRISRMRTEP